MPELDIPFKILVAENDPVFLGTLHEALGDKGFEIAMEKNGHGAMRIAEQGKTELLIVSLDLPRFEGYFLIRKIRKEDNLKKMPIICVASNVDKRRLAELHDLEVKDILTRPVEGEKLLAMVEKFYRIKIIAEMAKGGN